MLLKGTFFLKLCTNDYITTTLAQSGIKIAGRNINFRYADDITLWQKAKKNYRASLTCFNSKKAERVEEAAEKFEARRVDS